MTNFPKFLRDIQLKGRSDLTKMEERIIDTIPDTLEEFFDKNPEVYKSTKDCWSSLRSYFSDCWHQSRLHQHSSHSSQERRSPVLNTKETSHQWYQRKSKGESLFHLFQKNISCKNISGDNYRVSCGQDVSYRGHETHRVWRRVSGSFRQFLLLAVWRLFPAQGGSADNDRWNRVSQQRWPR